MASILKFKQYWTKWQVMCTLWDTSTLFNYKSCAACNVGFIS